MRKYFCVLLFLILLNSSSAQFFKKKKEPEKPEIKAKPKEATPSIADKTKTCKPIDGLFKLYRDTITGELFFQVSTSQLNKEFIHFTYTENGVLEAGHHRGSYRGSRIFKIQKHYEYLEFVQQNTSYYFDSTSEISKSANANISTAVLAREKIVAKDKDGTVLIAADELFLTEQLHVLNASRPAPGTFQLGKLTKGKTQYQSLKNYPKNLDIVVRYVFDNPAPAGSTSAAVTDNRSVNIVLQHSFMEVPENNFKPRFDDYRIGYFAESVNDMTTTGFNNYRDLIHRWNLVKKNPDETLSEPIQPIEWWIENTTPKALRPIIMHAALQWNKAFEPLGFKNAIRIYEQPDTASWDAGDIRYNVLRWTSSPNPPFGGYGPSFVNPRTGEILGADIMLEYVFLTNRIKLEEVNHPESGEHCSLGLHLYYQQQAANGMLQIIGSDTNELSRLMKESIHYLILHEMGHTLGMMHNMKASQLHTPEELTQPELTYKTGLIGSVMDYPAVNLPNKKGQKVQYCQIEPGPYDKWVIDYGYSIGLNDPIQESQRLANIARKSIQKELTFGNDADDMRAPGKGIDPRVMVNDLSSDALTYSAIKMEQIQQLLPEIFEQCKKDEKSFEKFKDVFNLLTTSLGTHAGIISRYIGGVYVERFEPNQNAGNPYSAVSKEEQLRALELLNKFVFSDEALKIPENYAYFLQSQRRGFGFMSGTENPKIHQRNLQIQQSVLDQLMNPTMWTRIIDSKYYGNTYSLDSYLGDLTNNIMQFSQTSPYSSHRIMLQTEFVQRLLKVVDLKNPANGYDAYAKAEAMKQLQRIKKWSDSNVGTVVSGNKMYISMLINSQLSGK
jgi:hypothetical protein